MVADATLVLPNRKLIMELPLSLTTIGIGLAFFAGLQQDAALGIASAVSLALAVIVTSFRELDSFAAWVVVIVFSLIGLMAAISFGLIPCPW